MTREEAVKRIKEIQKLYVFTPTINEALDLAIEALEQTETLWEKGMRSFDGLEKVLANRGDAESTTTTDCISRQAAIEAVRGCKFHAIKGSLQTAPWYEAINEVLEILSALPPVNQKQITGKLESAEIATSEGEESTMGQPKSKLDCISRADAIEAVDKYYNPSMYAFDTNKIKADIESLPSFTPKEQTDCTDFINWLLEEVLDEENWELNAVANGEIICRKLKKLGLLEVKDGYYVRASVTPTERTGEWIEDGYYDSPFRVCSYCGYEHQNQQGMWKFCPNCGAKMGGDSE